MLHYDWLCKETCQPLGLYVGKIVVTVGEERVQGERKKQNGSSFSSLMSNNHNEKHKEVIMREGVGNLNQKY